MNKAASLKARLKNLAEKQSRSFQEILQTYVLERTVFRISQSPFAENFTLKGGIFLYALLEGDFPRATTDIDLLCSERIDDADQLKQIFHDLFAMKLNDGLGFSLDTLEITAIAENRPIPGYRAGIICLIESTKIKVTVDVGFGDSIVPTRRITDFPVLLGDQVPRILAYSIESVVSEKLQAIIALGNFNSRYKDFYDIVLLARRFDFDGVSLKAAIQQTFRERNTGLPSDLHGLETSIAGDPLHQKRWEAFLRKKQVMLSISITQAMAEVVEFVGPPIDALRNGRGFEKQWQHEQQRWS